MKWNRSIGCYHKSIKELKVSAYELAELKTYVCWSLKQNEEIKRLKLYRTGERGGMNVKQETSNWLVWKSMKSYLKKTLIEASEFAETPAKTAMGI